ncbi:MAG: response regulator transcription factor [Actinomycetota bacterium]|nr:response regulator transcription factor [Actinomycetota bacterium]
MRILVAEDDPAMAALLRRSLEEEGYVIDHASGGEEAVWYATEWDYAAVVLDVMLPEIDGFEVCRRLRSAQRWSPVLMLTALDDVSSRVRGLDSGADDYLVKPFSLAELAARLRSLTRRATGERPVVLRVGDLELDPAAHRSTRGGCELDLTPREFALLELFLRNPGVVLTRTRILEQVWDFAFEGSFNVIDQYVAYLRRKIDRPFGRHDLETIRGVGYRLRRPDDPAAGPSDLRERVGIPPDGSPTR